MKKYCIIRPFTNAISMDRQKGFTIIELMIVITISAVLFAMTTLGFTTLAPAYRLKGAASLVRGDLYTAKIRAIKNNRQYKVVFSTNGYQIQRGISGSGAFALDTVETSRAFSEYPGVTIKTAATVDPVFSPRGTTTVSTITLQNTTGDETAFSISVAGRIKSS